VDCAAPASSIAKSIAGQTCESRSTGEQFTGVLRGNPDASRASDALPFQSFISVQFADDPLGAAVRGSKRV